MVESGHNLTGSLYPASTEPLHHAATGSRHVSSSMGACKHWHAWLLHAFCPGSGKLSLRLGGSDLLLHASMIDGVLYDCDCADLLLLFLYYVVWPPLVLYGVVALACSAAPDLPVT